MNQIETHPFDQQIETQAFLQDNTVQIESWGPFAEGRNNIFLPNAVSWTSAFSGDRDRTIWNVSKIEVITKGEAHVSSLLLYLKFAGH